ncbi:hypothetical protein L195_g020934 [Trifolium pratense]|uniref:Uncharacterized protein n=1 Tax=Trifolium pratense TaxID=57577 RepID=A0A2K3N3Q9_TRIPR|nr:hypothetical protein L195_g037619 [Trifolium pratense]PNX97701.1 hypothetical protein L195_g020934 [Trifolium pratense]
MSSSATGKMFSAIDRQCLRPATSAEGVTPKVSQTLEHRGHESSRPPLARSIFSECSSSTTL